MTDAPSAAAGGPAGERSAPAKGALAGPDGRLRCPWGLSAPDYLAYHDTEWGHPVHGDQPIFERLCLEAFQSGLSWLTILRKRENFRAAFHGFDPAVVAGFGPDDVTRLLGDAGIIRNRAKITAVIGNAKAALAVPGGLAALVWGYAEGPVDGRSAAPVSTGPVSTGPASTGPASTGPVSTAEVPAWTPASQALARTLKGYGFSFTGPVTVYAAFQACGVVNDHLVGCFCRGSAGPAKATGGAALRPP
jgi:DNA-3-methyladenine glycosylase I